MGRPPNLHAGLTGFPRLPLAQFNGRVNDLTMRNPSTLAALLAALFLPAPLPAAEESAFLQNTRQLILEGARSGEGYFRSDGKALVFQSEREVRLPVR